MNDGEEVNGDDVIKHARETLAAATPGPLEPLTSGEGEYGWPQPMPQGYDGEFTRADLDAIVLSVNAMPALLDVLDAARAALPTSNREQSAYMIALRAKYEIALTALEAELSR